MLTMSDTHSEAFKVTEDLLTQAVEAKSAGDIQGYQKYLQLAVLRAGDETKPRPQHTAKVISLLENGWNNVDDMSEATGLPASRIHMILTYLRQRGHSVQAKTIKRYRLVK